MIPDHVLVPDGDGGYYKYIYQDAPIPPEHPVWIDMRDVMPHNANSDNPNWTGGSDWAIVESKSAITIHHVGVEGASAINVAKWTTRLYSSGGKGLPRLQYHFWIDRNGTIRYCTDLKYGFWHDHGGYPNSHISVVFAGRCDVTRPPQVQMDAAVELVQYLKDEYSLSVVRGHNEVSSGLTICPGWKKWKDDFLNLLNSPLSFAIVDLE